ncbi:hypothetical protein FBU30_006726 [Linnemannia zychae]|nr:hypothetical protein FBU30_006726 [Linnemannia zychae]
MSNRSTLDPQILLPRSKVEFLQAHISSFSADQSSRTAEEETMTPQDPFQVLYRHLHEKHYFDRLIHALYHWSIRSQQQSGNRIDFRRIAFQNKTRVLYPHPCEINHSISQATEYDEQEPVPLLLLLLTEPELRFRLCLVSHLIEVAFDIGNGDWNGESPRHLAREDADYVLSKLQDLFKELFQNPNEQASLRRFVAILKEWISIDTEMEEEFEAEDSRTQNLGDEYLTGTSKLNIPHIVKKIFPCWRPILQEILNIKISAIGDESFPNEIATLFRFLFLSLQERRLAFADDWVDEARRVLSPIQEAFSSEKYRGPAQRLIREVVCMMDQLWEGGWATDISLAVEKCLAILIQKSLQTSSNLPDSGAGVGSNVGWDVLHEFELFIQAASRNIAPIPLPSITWKRNNSELIMNAVILQFPHLMPSNVLLSTSTSYDRQTNRSCRLWHLKISGLEIEAKKVAYKYASKSFLGGIIMDEGEFDIIIPPDSLNIEVTFTLTPPIVRRRTATALRASLSTVGRRHSIASVTHDNVFTTELENQDNQLRREQLILYNRNGSGHDIIASPPQSTRFRDTATWASEVERATMRAGVRVRPRLQEAPTSDFWSTAKDLVTSILYPNRIRPSALQGQQKRLNKSRMEADSIGRLTIKNRTTLHRLHRRSSAGQSNDGSISTSGLIAIQNSSESHMGIGIPMPPNTIPAITSHTAGSIYYDLVVEPSEMAQHKFMKLKKCSINLIQLNVDVQETHHPILEMVTHPIMVRRFRKAIEHTLRETMAELIDTINSGSSRL